MLRLIKTNLFTCLTISCFIISNAALASGGCLDDTACNFDPTATFDDGSCVYGDMELIVQNDTLCVQDGEAFNYNVLYNDGYCNGFQVQVIFQGGDECFWIDEGGQILSFGNPDVDCCGDHVFDYMVCLSDGMTCASGTVFLEVKCPKPDCSLIDLSEYLGADDPIGLGGGGCVHVCENSESTVFLPLDPTSSYNWTVIGGTFVAGANDAEIIVTWGPAGPGTIVVDITDSGGLVTTHVICIDIMEGPNASFNSSGYVCLGQQICFDNTSTNADAYYWDFGDGNSSTMEDPCHIYTVAGTYTVILEAVKYNYDEQGNPLCCCFDYYEMDVVVDPLPGPGIYWVSTLCEGDSSKYWTDATNCSSYVWTVEDADGNSVPFIGQGNDTICVTWTTGPLATITLDVAGCDSAYCANPTTVTVPIIPSIGDIEGPTEVCEFDTEVYNLPKWIGTTYLWTVTGGTVISGDSTHSATIQWGSAGTGHIHVDYYNDFLAGLPGHEYPDCYGTADLDVIIKPEFGIDNFGPSVVCVGDLTQIFASGFPLPVCNWTITPSVPFVDNGTSIDITWPAVGTYLIEASPSDTTVYCITLEALVVKVVDIPAPTGIDGPIEICPGDTYYYTAQTSEVGVNFTWTAVNGTLLSTTGATVGVTWGPSGPYSISVTQQMQNSPYCVSPPFTLAVNPKEIQGPLAISGTAACTNSSSVYTLSPAQHPDANIEWTVTAATSGSVVGGQGTANATVQWNNDPGPVTLTATVSLCGDTVSVNLLDTLFSPIIPVITQVGTLCPGGNVDLNTTSGFGSYSWSTGDTGLTTNITATGIYSLTTVDSNGCSATVYHEVNGVPGPTAEISTGNNTTICIPSPHAVTITAQTNPNLVFEWFCNGVSQGAPSATATFTHPFQGIAGTYTYYVVVTDTSTGCMNTSDPLDVFESDCTGGGNCTPEPYTLSINGVNQFPNCNIVDFTLTSTNFTLTSWYFGDGNTSGASNPSHTYTEAGCYYVYVEGTVPDAGGGAPCVVTEEIEVCVPIAAEFDWDYLTCTDVQFNDFSTYIVGAGNAITGWSWSFSPGSSGLQNPTWSFAGPGVYAVTLTVTNSNGCQASITHNVTINSVAVPVIADPSPLCAGDPATFSATAAGAVSWFWNFGDGATFDGPTPSHTYLAGGSYNVTLTVANEQGCQETSTLVLTVFPGIPPGVITASPGLTICAGSQTTLTAPAGYSYLWTNLATTQSINVGAGTYGVTLTDGDGCTLVLDPVEVVELPIPDATITGNLVICDSGCTILSAPNGTGLTYQWYDNGVPIPFATAFQLTVCDTALGGPYTVEVTDQNGCRNTSDPVTVIVAVSPAFTVNVAPDPCAGTPSILTVNPVQTNVVYAWSSGDTGPSMTTSQAGTYTVLGTDTITGCSSSASAIIHPLPDLCAVPVGCYEVCNPDTICGPLGLTTYQWNMNGGPLSGATDPCLEVTASGSYSLTATNEWGCEATSDSLYLIVINCDSLPCDDLSVDFNYLVDANGDIDSCCVSLSYTHNYAADLQRLSISTSDADFNWNLGSLDPTLNVASISANDISLDNIIPGNPLPTGIHNNFIDFCFENVVNVPQVVVFDWIDMLNDTVCSDTLYFECPPEPDCLYLQSDSIYCLDGETFYQMTVCNPADATYSIGFIDLVPISPVGIVLTPPDIDASALPIAPGTCQTFTIQLSGPSIGGSTFCYEMIAHEVDPAIDPATLCCSLDTTYCIDIPPCDPCEYTMVESVLPSSGEGCCYDIGLFNGFDGAYFDEIGVCVISPSTTMTVNNPVGSGWNTSGYTPTQVSFLPDATLGGFAPLGFFTLPEICIDTEVAPNQLLEIKWMAAGDVVCRDTIEVFCEPPCGYLFDETILCENGQWSYSASLKNMADYPVSEAVVTFNDPALSAYDATIALGTIPPGGIYSPFNLNIGPPAMAGDTVCFTVTIHEISPTGMYLSCCNFTHCVVLPDCPQAECVCDDEFNPMVEMGAVYTVSASNPNELTFSMAAGSYFSDCDEVIWAFGDGSPLVSTPGGTSITHVYPGPGSYMLCIRVIRTQPDGTQCFWKHCQFIEVLDVAIPPLLMYPNPTEGQFVFKFSEAPVEGVYLTVFDETRRPVMTRSYFDVEAYTDYEVDLTDRSKGVYFIMFQIGKAVEVKKLVVF